jgi:hypothetical protein
VSVGVQCRPSGLVESRSGGEKDGFDQVDTHNRPSEWTVKAGSAARPVWPNTLAKQTSHSKIPAIPYNFNLKRVVTNTSHLKDISHKKFKHIETYTCKYRSTKSRGLVALRCAKVIILETG